MRTRKGFTVRCGHGDCSCYPPSETDIPDYRLLSGQRIAVTGVSLQSDGPVLRETIAKMRVFGSAIQSDAHRCT